jgi:hypothetical protein
MIAANLLRSRPVRNGQCGSCRGEPAAGARRRGAAQSCRNRLGRNQRNRATGGEVREARDTAGKGSLEACARAVSEKRPPHVTSTPLATCAAALQPGPKGQSGRQRALLPPRFNSALPPRSARRKHPSGRQARPGPARPARPGPLAKPFDPDSRATAVSGGEGRRGRRTPEREPRVR